MITRKEATESIQKHFEYMQEYITPKDVLKVALEALKQPEIVRCQNCRYYEPDKYDLGNGDCNGPCDNLVKVSDDWFCADGVRK